MPSLKTALYALAALSACSSAWARTQSNPLHVSGGIAVPATSTSTFTNPAGLVGAEFSAVLQAGVPEFFESPVIRAGLSGGGPTYGVAAGVDSFEVDQDRFTNIYLGAAFQIGNVSLGLGGVHTLNSAPGGQSNPLFTYLNAGALMPLGSKATIGLTLRGITNGISEVGAGVAYAFTSAFSLVLDTAMTTTSDSKLSFKPGILLRSSSLAGTVSLGTGASQEFTEGLSVGLSYELSAKSSLAANYSMGGIFPPYYVGFTLKF